MWKAAFVITIQVDKLNDTYIWQWNKVNYVKCLKRSNVHHMPVLLYLIPRPLPSSSSLFFSSVLEQPGNEAIYQYVGDGHSAYVP